MTYVPPALEACRWFCRLAQCILPPPGMSFLFPLDVPSKPGWRPGLIGGGQAGLLLCSRTLFIRGPFLRPVEVPDGRCCLMS
jgi:hypothetical protein